VGNLLLGLHATLKNIWMRETTIWKKQDAQMLKRTGSYI